MLLDHNIATFGKEVKNCGFNMSSGEVITLSDSDDDEGVSPLRPDLEVRSASNFKGLTRNPSGQTTLAFSRNVRKQKPVLSNPLKSRGPKRSRGLLPSFVKNKSDQLKISITDQGAKQVERTEVKLFFNRNAGQDGQDFPKKTARKTMKYFAPRGLPVAGDTCEPEILNLSEDEHQGTVNDTKLKTEPDRSASKHCVQDAVEMLLATCHEHLPGSEETRVESKFRKKLAVLSGKSLDCKQLEHFIIEGQHQIVADPDRIYVYLKQLLETIKQYTSSQSNDKIIKEELQIKTEPQSIAKTCKNESEATEDDSGCGSQASCTPEKIMARNEVDVNDQNDTKPSLEEELHNDARKPFKDEDDFIKKENRNYIVLETLDSHAAHDSSDSDAEFGVFNTLESLQHNDEMTAIKVTPMEDVQCTSEQAKHLSQIVTQALDPTHLASSSQQNKANDGKPKPKASLKHIKKLEKALNVCQKEIKRLENADCDLDEEDSNYLKVSRYKAKLVKIYTKLAQLQGCPTDLGRKKDKKFKFNDSRIPEFNEQITKFINKQRKKNLHYFPDFPDILNLMKSTNDALNVQLSKEILLHEAKQAFTLLGDKLKRRRVHDDRDVLESYIPENHEETPISDPVVLSVLEENLKLAKCKLDEVIENFVQKQLIQKEDLKDIPEDEVPSEIEENLDEENENNSPSEELHLSGNLSCSSVSSDMD